MITSFESIEKKNAVYYPVDLKFVTDLSSDLSNTADGLGQAWYKISQVAVEHIILTALKINYVLNHRTLLLIYNKKVPDMDLINIIQSSIMVPRFVRDLIREILRPMHHSGITYIPDLDLSTRPTPHLLDTFYPIAEHLTRWNNVCQKLGFEMVPILPEAVQSVSLTFYSYETDELLSFDNLINLDWRIEAFGWTKHLVHNPTSEVDELGKTQTATSRKRVQEKDYECDDFRKVYERPLQNRRILGMIVYRYTCAPYTMRLGHLSPNYRFPTEKNHSETPPTSNRVLLSEQTMVHSIQKNRSKPKKVKIVTTECSTDRSH
ncbi:capsid protein [Cryptosporidium parvum virus 1]|uniref:Capsid protein n=1 Tax=Cryptosporidium parvum virus 1 TaxID=675060 RepID=A0A1X9YLT6_9VIRU|nr:capsid protein [Cryptosporidium parvum virus 1]ARS33772.1 capsid protein [Cryptosporidium parvum virus 1]